MPKNKEKDFNINDYKSEIDKYIKERVEKESASNSVKLYKRQLRNKSIAIFIEFIIIVCLLITGAYCAYYLYKDGYFDNKINILDNQKSNKPTNNDVPVNKEDGPTLDELVNKYSSLLDNFSIDTKCDYINDFYNGNLTDEIKEYFTYQLFDKDDIIIDDTSSFFDSNILIKAYKLLFNDDLKLTSFKYNGISYKYLESKNMFISTSLPTSGTKIIKEITNIEEKNDNVIITTTEGYIKDNKLYNILTNKEITEYKKDEKISKYSKKLNVVTYTFNNKYLISIK